MNITQIDAVELSRVVLGTKDNFTDKIGAIKRPLEKSKSISVTNLFKSGIEEPQEPDSDVVEFHMLIKTKEGGHNAGRSYVHRILSREEADSWLNTLKNQVKEAKLHAEKVALEEEHGHSKIAFVRAKTLLFYNSNTVQYAVAFLIIFGFVLDMSEAQVLPKMHSPESHLYTAADIMITVLFCAELLINIFSKSNDNFAPFMKEWSNLFDACIVVTSIVSLLLSALQLDIPSLKMLRLIRVGRVIRLFKRFRELQKIISAVSAAVVPVCNAFFILLICTAIYATLGTHIFGERSPEHFADFLTSLFTMFQVVSGDGWASTISRSLFHEGKTDHAVAFFFVSFYFINTIVLLNVVVAVLLDEFITAVTREKEDLDRLQIIENRKNNVTGILDPLTQNLKDFGESI